ncbi:MAG: GH35 family beta-galactosidase [Mucilaginibacter sp.]
MKTIAWCFALVSLTIGKTFGQIPSIVEKNGRHTLLVDGKPFLILGGQAHNSSAWPGMLPQLWSAVEKMHANTLEVPIYWEQIETRRGVFDFSMIDKLLIQSRQHKVRLVLLWFATWKNGSSHYMPEWMKREPSKYPNITGKNGQPIDSPSPNIKATMDADINAFKAVMRYLKRSDTQHTVIMVQVENESGAWGSVRDYSALAQKLFEGPVPSELLKPAVLKSLNVPVVTEGSWQKVFGDRADEYFHAWSVARFIGQVAAAGKAEYPLPMYVNVALRDPLTNPSASNYESGGPTDNVIPIWKVAAPAIDLLAPDIYLSGSERVLKVIDLYDRHDNALFVPEAGLIPENAKYLYPVIARGGIGFSPFGIDNNGQALPAAETAELLAPFTQKYAVISPMMKELAKWGFEGRINAVVEHDDHADQTINLGSWQAVVSFGLGGRGSAIQTNDRPVGSMMIVQLDKNKFILVGQFCHITFHPVGDNAGKAWQYLKVEEGHYENGVFKSLRILNGDETDWGGPGFGNTPTVLQTTLITR